MKVKTKELVESFGEQYKTKVLLTFIEIPIVKGPLAVKTISIWKVYELLLTHEYKADDQSISNLPVYRQRKMKAKNA
jgi:hypothetical protein